MLYYTEMYTDFNWTIYFMEIYTADCTELHRKYMELYIFLNYTKVRLYTILNNTDILSDFQ